MLMSAGLSARAFFKIPGFHTTFIGVSNMDYDTFVQEDRRRNTTFDEDIRELRARGWRPYQIWRVLAEQGKRIALTTVCRRFQETVPGRFTN